MRASHWSEKRAEDFCLSVRDGTHDSPKPTTYGKKLITSKNIIGSHISLENSYRISIEDAEKVDKRSLVEQWDVLISMIGTVGEVCLIKEKPDFSIKNIGLFKSKGKEEGVYLYYYLKSQLAKNYIENRLAGSTQKYISLTELRNIPIKYPKNREEMCAINYVLSYLDDKIDLNRRTNETLEAMARALFRDWFIDFGPTRAKMAGEAPYLSLELWELFPERLDDEGKPEEWLDGTLEDIANLQNGYAFKSSDWLVDGIPVVKIGAVKPSVVDLKNVSFVDSKFLKEKPNFILQSGDILIGLTGYVGEVGRVPPSQLTPMLNQRVARFLPEASFYAYIFCIGRQKEFKEFVENQAHGSAQANVSTKDVLTYPIVIPTMNLSALFDENIGLILEKIDENLSEIDTLTQLRDLLLPKLMSGEISIRDAEKMVEDAA